MLVLLLLLRRRGVTPPPGIPGVLLLRREGFNTAPAQFHGEKSMGTSDLPHGVRKICKKKYTLPKPTSTPGMVGRASPLHIPPEFLQGLRPPQTPHCVKSMKLAASSGQFQLREVRMNTSRL